MMRSNPWIVPDWPAPKSVKALQTTRAGGTSTGPFDSLNLAMHVNDEIQAVQRNRAILREYLPVEPVWLQQVHGTRVIDAAQPPTDLNADASFSRQAGVVCVSLTADCLPVLFCDQSAQVVAVAHAGWRGLCDGVLESTVAAMQAQPQQILAWLGPAIGAQAFQVGDEVRQAFLKQQDTAHQAFVKDGERWLADIYMLARMRLHRLGITQIYGGDFCTMRDSERFFSFRRDPVCGRMASLIWIE